jgi:carbamoyltransferase
VLESECQNHFALDHSSPFMLETCDVISEIDLPAITHIDGSARVQTVNGSSNSRFAALIAEFHRRTGCPILLNTSFNLRGEPIVCTHVDAIRTFTRSQIDLLVIEDFAVERSGIPLFWESLEHFSDTTVSDAGRVVDHSVYTML